MHIYFLAAAAILLAAILWYRQAFGTSEKTPPPPPEEHAEQRLRRILAGDSGVVSGMADAIRTLESVMEHPELGGPGFLMIQFPPPDSGHAVITAQYPNIREDLYRRIVRQELDGGDLIAAGVPAALLSLNPSFETESGGIVLLSVQVGGIPAAFAESLRSRRERSIALGVLTEALAAKLPQLSIRIFGADILLSPDRAATSIDG